MSTDEPHTRVMELLPWFVNGTLEDHERALVERHVGECLPCRIALNEERRLRTLVSEQASVPLSPERGFSDLIDKIETTPEENRACWPLQQTQRYAWALAACMAIAGFVAWNTLPRENDPTEGTFSTLSSGTSGRAAQIDVIFAEELDESQRLDFVLDINGTVVSGPSELGRYTIELRGDELDDDRLTDLLTTLHDDSRVSFAARSFISEDVD